MVRQATRSPGVALRHSLKHADQLVFMQGNTLVSLTDVALGVALPIHSHISMNGILSDYVPPRYMGALKVQKGDAHSLACPVGSS